MTSLSVSAEPGTDPAYPEVRVFSDLDPEADTADMVRTVERLVREALRHRGIGGGARVRLSTPTAPDDPILIQINLLVRDKPVRMQTLNDSPHRWDAVLRRLDRQIVRAWGPWRPRPWPDSTRTLLTAPGHATIIRRKEVAAARTTPWCASEILDAMDYNMHLFTDVETGEEAVVYRAGPTGLRLVRQRHVHPPREPGPDALVVNSRPAPTLTEDTALARLCDHRLHFVFFTDADSGRGKLLYPRYDGGIGLITPTGGVDAVTG